MESRTPNKKNLRMWVRALRSGQYPQGSAHLRRNGKYCCLGVAMDMALANGVKATGRENWGGLTMLPSPVDAFYGLDKCDITVVVQRGRSRYLSDLNDSGFSFGDIADLIEAKFALDQED